MSVCLSVCLYVCICMYVCMCVCMCVYVCIYVCMYACMYVCMYVCVYVCMCVCVLCMYVCMYVCMHACMYVCMCVCMCVCVCMYHIIPYNTILPWPKTVKFPSTMQCRPNMRTNCWNTLFTPMAPTEAKHILLRSSAEFLGHGRSAVHGRGPCAPDLPPTGNYFPLIRRIRECGLPFWSKKLGTAITRGYIAMVCVAAWCCPRKRLLSMVEHLYEPLPSKTQDASCRSPANACRGHAPGPVLKPIFVAEEKRTQSAKLAWRAVQDISKSRSFIGTSTSFFLCVCGGWISYLFLWTSPVEQT